MTTCREIGAERAKRRQRKNANPSTQQEIIIRLHARACQVCAEVLCLMEGGFADAAMARWRTLHEIYIVSLLIYESDEDLAVRYVRSEAVESKRAMDEYLR